MAQKTKPVQQKVVDESTRTDEAFLKAQVAQVEERYKRALADYQNLAKRTAVERAQFIKLANAGLLEKFLGVLDDLERAQQHLNDQGLTLVLQQFRRVLESEGVKEIDALHQVFDAHFMECVDRVAGAENVVSSVIRKGYRLNDTVLRPAQVHVGNGS